MKISTQEGIIKHLPFLKWNNLHFFFLYKKKRVYVLHKEPDILHWSFPMENHLHHLVNLFICVYKVVNLLGSFSNIFFVLFFLTSNRFNCMMQTKVLSMNISCCERCPYVLKKKLLKMPGTTLLPYYLFITQICVIPFLDTQLNLGLSSPPAFQHSCVLEESSPS